MPEEKADRVDQEFTLPPDEAEELIAELQQQATQLEEQAAELEELNVELSASEARLRGIVDSALDAIVTTDAESVILGWNHHAERLFGWSAKEAIGQNLTRTIIPPQYRERHERGLQHYLATGEGPILNNRIEITALDRAGREFPVELTVAPARWGTRVIFTAFIRDLTARKQAEQQMLAQHAVTRVLADSRTVGDALPRILEAICTNLGWQMGVFWSVDAEAGVLRPIEIWTDPSMTGGELEDVSRDITFAPGRGLPGRVWESNSAAWIRDVTKDLNFPRHVVAARLGICSALAFPIVVSEEFIGVMEFFQRPIAEPDAALLAAMAATGSDIGQFIKRRQAEERLSEREEIQRFFARVSAQFAASTPDYEETLRNLARHAVPTLCDWCTIYLADENGQIQRLKTTHADPAQDMLAQALERYPVDPDGAHPAIRALQNGEPALFPEVPDALLTDVAQDEEHARLMRSLNLRSGMAVPLRVRGRALGAMTLLSAGSGRRYDAADLEVAVEFADRAALAVDNARLYAEARRASQAKSDFLATMSHELRTPINAVAGYVDLMELGIGGAPTDRQREYLERIRASSEHLLGLVDEVLDLAKIEENRVTVRAEPVPLREVAVAAVGLVAAQAAAKNIRLADDSDCYPLWLHGDPGRVRQILVNLLSNAIKFTDPGGTIALRCRVASARPKDAVLEGEGPWVGATVEDTGIGIPPADLDRIFAPFEQIDQSHARQHEGAGLGLAISRRLARLMSGDLVAESQAGRGSRFTLWLPALVAEPPPETLSEDGPAWPQRPGEVPGVAALGHFLSDHAGEIARTAMDRVVQDPAIQHAKGLDRAQLDDHVVTFLLEIGKNLVVLEEGGGEPALMRDGTDIQRLIADLHGGQRARLGWTADEVRREYAVLRDEVLGVIRSAPPPEEEESREAALAILARLMDRAERISVAGFEAERPQAGKETQPPNSSRR